MAQHIIIFDGPDGCGKTEMGKALSQITGIPYFRMATQHENWRKGAFKTALEFDQTYIAEFLRQTGHSAIIDRAYPSEWVYSRVFGRETNERVLEQVDNTFADLGARIVIPIRDLYVKEDEVIPNEKMWDIHDAYLEFRKWTSCSTHVMNVDVLKNNLQAELSCLLQDCRILS